jgi:hypothetical protein
MASEDAAHAVDPVQMSYAAVAQSLANAGRNATTAQQQGWVTAQAATTQGIATLYSLDTAAAGAATSKELRSTSG